MRYASVCSGVEAPSVAWERMGWKAVFFSEIEEFPSEVLKARYPNVPNLGDMTKIRIEKDEITNGSTAIPFHAGDVDVFVGGTPCQSYSCAGQRRGLEDPRGMLMLDFIRLAYELRTRWILWENVPGVLSQDHGNAFRQFLSGLAGWDVKIPGGKWKNAGVITNATSGNYGLAYRVLDAQYVRTKFYPHGIPHRRERVFLVGHLGDFSCSEKVLSVFESVRWVFKEREGNWENHSSFAKDGNEDKFGNFYENHPQDSRISVIRKSMFTLSRRCGTGGGNLPLVRLGGSVRKLLPVECERLMGFPDNYTRIPWNGKTEEYCPDGHRYKACGNSMCVNCMEYLGRKIEEIEKGDVK